MKSQRPASLFALPGSSLFLAPCGRVCRVEQDLDWVLRQTWWGVVGIRISITFVFSCYNVTVFPFMIQEQLITSSFCKILGWSIQYSVICKVHYRTLQYLPTLARKNLCVPSTSTQAGWDGCWKKKALSVRRICQHATILERQSWALDCFCHCDVFSTINWLLSFLEMDFLGNWIHISHFWIYHL